MRENEEAKTGGAAVAQHAPPPHGSRRIQGRFGAPHLRHRIQGR
ncbi:hypothetical protein OIU91_09070 [Streptomyces sp. NBC_01456]|nr:MULTISPECIES: hypothetical protein [unclassified Streptomyces]